METSMEVGGTIYSVTLRRRDTSWGHGVGMDMFDADGVRVGSCSLLAHPEFDGYGDVQSKTSEGLLEVAIARLRAGDAARVLEAYQQSGISLVLPLNGPMPNNAMEPTR